MTSNEWLTLPSMQFSPLPHGNKDYFITVLWGSTLLITFYTVNYHISWLFLSVLTIVINLFNKYVLNALCAAST